MFKPLWQICSSIGLNFTVTNGQILKKIFNHLVTLPAREVNPNVRDKWIFNPPLICCRSDMATFVVKIKSVQTSSAFATICRGL